jgi:hypothetical protein
MVLGGAVALLALASALAVSDSTGANLQLAPVFVGAALSPVFLRTCRSRSRHDEG